VPRPGAIGIGVELGFAVKGFVDVLMLPYDAARWPTLGTVTEFEIIHMDDRPQIRLRPVDPRYRDDDPETPVQAPTRATQPPMIRTSGRG
jgi:hypothetical protein